MVKFYPDTHQYFNEKGEEYISVTTLLKKEFPFDMEKIAKKVSITKASKYYARPVKDIIKEWEDSSVYGNEVHESIEDYINSKVIPTNHLKPIVEQFSKLKFRGRLLSETLVWDDKYKIAGTIDILEMLKTKIYLYDIKTSAKMYDSKLTKYSFQLEIYSRLARKHFQMPVKPIGIFWYDDYVKQRENCKLKILRPFSCASVVDDILSDRLDELNG